MILVKSPGKSDIYSLLDEFFEKEKSPVSPEYIFNLIVDGESGILGARLSNREIAKIREYIRMYTIENLMDRVAGGVIYPRPVPCPESTSFGFSRVWIKLIELTYEHGVTFGLRKILTNVYVDGMDIRPGRHHYRDVGYTSSLAVRAWGEYFDDLDLETFRDNLEARTGFSATYRCKADNSCLDSVSITFTSSISVVVHANYKVSNLNRMTLMDFYLLHRFVRLLFPLSRLPQVKLSCYFNCLALDLDMMGWLINVPRLKGIIDKHKVRGKSGYKRVDLPKEFYKKKKVRDVGVNLFINNNYGLEVLNGEPYNPSITYNAG
jgi:hypothetical protein